MIGRVIRQVVESYQLAGLICVAAFPILFWPMGAEGLQHAVEFHLGMFRPGDGVSTASEAYVRLCAEAIKVLGVLYASVVAARYFVLDRRLDAAVQFDAAARRAVLIGFAFILLIGGYLLFAAPLVVWFVRGLDMDLPRGIVLALAMLPVLLATWPLYVRSMRWLSELLGDKPIPVERSQTVANRLFIDSIAVPMIAIAPLFVLHDLFNRAAVELRPDHQILLLAADSVLVGAIAALLASLNWVIYRDARDA